MLRCILKCFFNLKVYFSLLILKEIDIFPRAPTGQGACALSLLGLPGAPALGLVSGREPRSLTGELEENGPWTLEDGKQTQVFRKWESKAHGDKPSAQDGAVAWPPE